VSTAAIVYQGVKRALFRIEFRMGSAIQIVGYTAGSGRQSGGNVRVVRPGSPACKSAFKTSAFLTRRRVNSTVAGLPGIMISGRSRFPQGSCRIRTKLECSLKSRTGTARLTQRTRIVTKGNAGVNSLQTPPVAAISIAGVGMAIWRSSASSTVVGRPIVLAGCGETRLNDFRNLKRL
jgi:hypothetical protein